VITDISDAKWQEVHKALAISAPDVCRVVYYDNPEKFVPGGYSETAAKVIPLANLVLFASARFEDEPIFSKPGVEMDFEGKKRIGLGLYPTEEADTIKKLRDTEAKHLRRQLFDQLAILDEEQKIIAYLGGANDVYYEKAFPRFLEFVALLREEDQSLYKRLIFLHQQHPRAAKEGNRDVNKITEGVVLSKFSTNQSLAISALAIYYQTSMAAQLPLAHVPALQAGHETFADSLTENGFPSATDYENFKKEISKLFEGESKSDPMKLEKVKSSVGMRDDWKERWFHFLHL
jgi:hypothetical protein